jgi:Leu/Phe-tRNA-protein transferase
VAFAHLVLQLRRWGFELIDCQMSTSHLASLGAREESRAAFNQQLSRLVRLDPIPGPWRVEADLARDPLSTMTGGDGDTSGCT